jgi:hypothetical protein
MCTFAPLRTIPVTDILYTECYGFTRRCCDSLLVVYLTSSSVNWGFLAGVGQFATRVKRAF